MFLAQFIIAQSGLQHWTTREGLSSNWVTQITQDEKGYIWVATQYGLNRFDGYEFEPYYYEPNTPNSLLANWTRSIEKDTNGIFWLGTYYGGVSAFQYQQNQFTHYPIFLPDSTLVTGVYQVLATPKAIWVSSANGLYVKDKQQQDFRRLAKERIWSIKQNTTGQIFCLTNHNIQIFDALNFEKVDSIVFEGKRIRQIFIDHENILWAFRDNEVIRIHQKRGNWQKMISSIDDVPSGYYFADVPIYEDLQNQIWIGGQRGISIVSADRKSIRTIPAKDFFADDDFNGQTLTFFEDRDQNFWIGTTEGIFLRSPYTKRFEAPLNLNATNQLDELRTFVQIDSFFFVSNPMELSVFNLNNAEQAPITLLEKPIHNLSLNKEGKVYAAGHGLYRIDPQTLKIEVLDTKFSNSRSAVEDTKGRIWFNGIVYLSYLDPLT
ncbi:MAG: two-component regulator propeller domain-containing protein, partial [Bacteroidota bacterium]